jgi:hypothetical protein
MRLELTPFQSCKREMNIKCENIFSAMHSEGVRCAWPREITSLWATADNYILLDEANEERYDGFAAD